MSDERAESALLAVSDLSVSFETDRGILRALSGVSFEVGKKRTVALVGESGSGKSVTAQAILRLLPSPPGRIDGGDVVLEGNSLYALPEREMRAVRGGSIGMVFQEPGTSLNPVYTVGFQIGEAVRMHRRVSRRETFERVRDLLFAVRFPNPEEAMKSYPHELSGGMQQRVMIAIAIAANPALLVADEPTASLDATIQADILDLLAELKERLGMSLLLIAHDLALVARVADAIVVMYAGQVVESGPARGILTSPRHPYTRGLLASIPKASTYRARGQKARRLPTIGGVLPDLHRLDPWCRFAPRCPEAFDRCRLEPPPLYAVGDGAASRCFLADPERAPRERAS